jgi:hypothetical protein
MKIGVPYEITNDFILLPGVIVSPGIEFKWRDREISGSAIISSGTGSGIIELHARRRGRYKSSGGCCYIKDMSGFFNIRLSMGAEEQLTVLPGTTGVEDSLNLAAAGGMHISRRVKKKRSDELLESRQYFPGDDVRRINWKAFAHSGELFIRLGEELPLPESRLTIAVDLSPPGKDSIDAESSSLYLDYFIARLSGLIEHFNESGISVDLIVPGGEDLAGLWWTDEAADAGITGGTAGGACLVLTTAFSGRAAGLCRKASAAGFNVFAALPVPEPEAEGPQPGLVKRLLFATAAETNEAVLTSTTAVKITENSSLKRRELIESGGVRDAYLI